MKLSRESKFLGTTEDWEKLIACSAGREEKWQPYTPVDPSYSAAITAGHIYMSPSP